MKTVPLRYAAALVVEPSAEELPAIQLEHVASGTGQIALSPEVTPPAGNNRFRPGDVLFSKLRPYLAKSLVVTCDLQGSGEFLCMRPTPYTDARFLFYASLSRPWLDYAVTTSYGAKMPRTSWEQMTSFQLPALGLEEQRRIADFLDDRVARIDQIIAARRRQVVLVDERLTSELSRVITGIPATLIPLSRLVDEIVVGIVIQPSKLYTSPEEGVPALRGLNVREGHFELNDLVTITHAGNSENPRSQLRPRDVVVVRTGAAGSSAVIPESMAGWNCIDLVIVRCGSVSSPAYVSAVVNAARRADLISAASSGSIQQHFGVGALSGLQVPNLPRKEQDAPAAEMSQARLGARNQTADLTRSIDLLTEYKSSLITAAVTGELDVTAASRRIPGE